MLANIQRRLSKPVYVRTIMSHHKKNFPYIHFVPQQQVWVIERMGKKQKEAHSGLLFTLPFFDNISYKRGLIEDMIEVTPQHAVTEDNVQVSLDGMVYYIVHDVHKSCYNITTPSNAISNLAQSVMRRQVGSMTLDQLFHNRAALNKAITTDLGDLNERWGIEVTRYEIQDISTGRHTSEAMEKQSAAEREKRATILKSEGNRQKEINEAEAKATAVKLEAEAHATAVTLAAEAQATAINKIATAIIAEGGHDAVQTKIATEYIKEMSRVLGDSKTVIVPNDPTNVAGLIKQAMAIAKT